MANNWKCETHSANADPEIITENWVPVEREIIFENWVAADWWNRQRTLIHDWRMKSIEKTESSLTHGIASETASLLTINRQRKRSRYRPWNHNWNLSDSWRVEWTAWPTHHIDSENRLTINYGIIKHTLPKLIHKSSPKTKSLLNEKSSFKVQSRLTDGIDNEH